MFNRRMSAVAPELDEVITNALKQLDALPAYSPEYVKVVDQIERFTKMKEHHRSARVSPDTLAIVLGNLAGIVLIIKHEHVNVIATKAMGLLLKTR